MGNAIGRGPLSELSRRGVGNGPNGIGVRRRRQQMGGLRWRFGRFGVLRREGLLFYLDQLLQEICVPVFF